MPSSLLTAEQQARLDAAVAEAALSRSPGNSSLLGRSPDRVCKVGRPHSKTSKQPGSGTHWGSVFDSCAPPVHSLDSKDPNYDDDEVAYVLRARESPRVDSVALFKHSIESLVAELFATGDVAAACEELRELDQPLYGHYAVKKAVTMSLDHGSKEKELVAQLLSAACPQQLTHDQVGRGVLRLLDGAQDLALDVPDAPAQLALFIARAVSDDVLSPAFIASAAVRPSLSFDQHLNSLSLTLAGTPLHTRQEHLPDTASAARAALAAAKAHLAAPVPAETLAHAWGDRAASTLAGAKAAVSRILGEFFVTRDVGEAARSLHDLHVPFFAHEAVKRALLAAMEHGDREAAALALLTQLAQTGAVSTQQMALGFSRAGEGLDDLVLDVPDAKQRWALLLDAARTAGLLRHVHVAGGVQDEAQVAYFKGQCSDIVAEYLASASTDDVEARLTDLLASPCAGAIAAGAQPSGDGANGPAITPGAVFVKRLITAAADRGPRCRESAAVLLSSLVPGTLSRGDVEVGLSLLLQNTEDLTLDVPDAPELLLLYMLRAIVDDVVTPSWLRHTKAALAGTAGGEVARAAVAALGARHVAERALRAWVGPNGVSAAGVKQSLDAMLAEYLTTRDVQEATKCLRLLELPFYTHEAVKRACLAGAEKGGAAVEAVATLLAHWADTGAASTQQLGLGLRRAAEAMDDLELDAPGACERWAQLIRLLAAAGVKAA